MKSSLTQALDELDKTLDGLEKAAARHTKPSPAKKAQPQLDLSARDEEAVKRKVAMKLDQTIERLEALLSGEE